MVQQGNCASGLPLVIGRIGRLLDEQDDRTMGTSMRIPESLRDAAALAVAHIGAESDGASASARHPRDRGSRWVTTERANATTQTD
jgi:hypothetical protein